MTTPERIGQYEILGLIGRGAMGEVYKVADTKLFGRHAALKILAFGAGNTESVRARFRREIEVVSRLHHPNIITIYDWGEHAGRDYFVMEYIEGTDLSAIIADPGSRTLAQRIEIAHQICDGLEVAHNGGVIHRDIKPANIMIEHHSGRDIPKLVDFGVVRLEASELTRSESQPGTFAYMSPEQLRNDHVDLRSDLFSLGIVLYELFAGVHPFEETSAILVPARILKDDPLPLHGAAAEVPASLDDLVATLLRKEPSERPRSAGDVADALEHVDTQGLRTAPRPVARVRSSAEPAVAPDQAPTEPEPPSPPTVTHPSRPRPTEPRASREVRGRPMAVWAWALLAAAVIALGAWVGWVVLGEKEHPSGSPGAEVAAVTPEVRPEPRAGEPPPGTRPREAAPEPEATDRPDSPPSSEAKETPQAERADSSTGPVAPALPGDAAADVAHDPAPGTAPPTQDVPEEEPPAIDAHMLARAQGGVRSAVGRWVAAHESLDAGEVRRVDPGAPSHDTLVQLFGSLEWQRLEFVESDLTFDDARRSAVASGMLYFTIKPRAAPQAILREAHATLRAGRSGDSWKIVESELRAASDDEAVRGALERWRQALERLDADGVARVHPTLGDVEALRSEMAKLSRQTVEVQDETVTLSPSGESATIACQVRFARTRIGSNRAREEIMLARIRLARSESGWTITEAEFY